AVDAVHAGAAQAQHLNRVPFSRLVFVVLAADDAALDALDEFTARLPRQTLALLLDLRVHDAARDAVVIAAVVLLNLALLRAHPERARRPVRPDAVVQEAAVAHRVLARRPLLRAPLELQLDVIILELVLARQGPEGLAGNAD